MLDYLAKRDGDGPFTRRVKYVGHDSSNFSLIAVWLDGANIKVTHETYHECSVYRFDMDEVVKVRFDRWLDEREIYIWD